MVSLINDDKPFTIDRSRLEGTDPQANLSWTPLPHHELMNRVEKRIQDYGYRIQHSNCLLSHGGDRFREHHPGQSAKLGLPKNGRSTKFA